MISHTSSNEFESKLMERYNLLKPCGVMNMLQDYYDLKSWCYSDSDTSLVSCMLLDFENILHNVTLTDRQNEIIALHFKKGLTQTEVAEKLGISQQAVSKHVENALIKISKKAEEELHK